VATFISSARWPRTLGISTARMSERLTKCRVFTPEFCVGEVAGELSRIGGWLDNLSGQSPTMIVHARIPPERISELEAWLKKVSRGQGKVENDGE
jgi:hypothetical protein